MERASRFPSHRKPGINAATQSPRDATGEIPDQVRWLGFKLPFTHVERLVFEEGAGDLVVGGQASVVVAVATAGTE